MMYRFALILLSAGLLASCSGGSKRSDASSSSSAESAPAAATTSEAILQKYSLQELNSAANALKVMADAEKGQDPVGCGIASDKALSMTMPLKALIDQRMRTEVQDYEQDPKSYANTEGFEICAKNCSCGVYSDIVEAARESSLPKNSAVQHKRNLTRLKAKAERQTAEASTTCAKKQNWFCSSDLRKFLDKGASEMP
jgi:hypothetical protein